MAHIKFVKVVNYLAIAVTSQSKDRKHLNSPIVMSNCPFSSSPSPPSPEFAHKNQLLI